MRAFTVEPADRNTEQPESGTQTESEKGTGTVRGTLFPRSLAFLGIPSLTSRLRKRPRALRTQLFADLRAVERCNRGVLRHRHRRGAAGGFAQGHRGGGDTRRSMRAARRGMTSAGDQQVLDLLGHQRTIRYVVRLRLRFLRIEIVRAADNCLVRMQVQVPGSGGDGVDKPVAASSRPKMCLSPWAYACPLGLCQHARLAVIVEQCRGGRIDGDGSWRGYRR